MMPYASTTESVGGAVDDSQVFLKVLGPVRLYRGPVALDPGPVKQRRVLAALALRANSTVLRDELVEMVWPQSPPRSAVNLVHTYVARLRRILEPGHRRRGDSRYIQSTGGGYQYDADSEHLDLLRFEHLRTQGLVAEHRGDLHVALEKLRTALSLWEGGVAADIGVGEDLHWPTLPIRLRFGSTAVELTRVAALQGELPATVPFLATATHHEPLDETLHICFMLALADSGRQATAVGVYHELRDRLGSELGVEPGPNVREAFEHILRDELPATTLLAS
ncbi:transcriptional regulator, SARP family [Actinokineospora spheciospongiae]|uniref:Transcriptional regulator, SARP family n=2 Tax=Actinokineospora spheciospongiae TaxID=909613 RepID=W7IVP1_9PSEU|nr:transcriptional regulator, SARP family [Actinokineospora spheciospongiae]